jgi:oxygen-independent coproporphyrinogen-3 oxidase
VAAGLYVHIPFCAAICNYCNFNRGLLDEALKRRYIDALVGEIAAAAPPGTPVDTIFFGGGTPSLLDPAEVARILDASRAAFAVDPGAEVTLEANPESATAATLAGYRAAGVNRLSYGVQSFDEAELRRLGRLHSVDTAVRAVTLARAAGFDNLSLDLMLWLPGQELDTWLSSVERLIEVGPDHASIYLLEIYPNAPLREEMARGGWLVAPDDIAAEMYVRGLGLLEAAGYAQYEISNVARPGRRSRHNLKYWQGGEWIGVGCGAHSTFGGQRWRNVSAPGDYVRLLASNQSPRLDVRTLSGQERLEEALFMGLRLVEGLDIPIIRSVHGVDVWEAFAAELSPFVESGHLVHVPGRRLALTRDGMLVANEIMEVFIGPAVR